MKTTLLISFVLLANIVEARELRKRVIVIDAGITASNLDRPEMCKDGHIDLTGTKLVNKEPGHGDNIAGIIAKGINKKTHCINIYKWWDSKTRGEDRFVYTALMNAVYVKPALVNMSMSGGEPSKDEHDMLLLLAKMKVPVVVAAGNDGAYLGKECFIYPACYKTKTLIPVGGSDFKGTNYGIPKMQFMPGKDQEGYGIFMSGTSQAAANYSRTLLSAQR